MNDVAGRSPTWLRYFQTVTADAGEVARLLSLGGESTLLHVPKGELLLLNLTYSLKKKQEFICDCMLLKQG